MTLFKQDGRSFQITGLRCSKCEKPFRHQIEVDVPIEDYVASMTAVRCPFCGSRKLSLGEGRTLAEDRVLRIYGGDTLDRATRWTADGEVGLSSDLLRCFMLGEPTPADTAAPADLDDARRCVLLLDRIPEWNARMATMGRVPGWEKLAPGWADFQSAYLSESPNLDRPAPQAGRILAQLLNRK